METAAKSDNGMTSVAAFVEGGVQEACDDACSICLDDFSEMNPSTVTNCRHDFHLQCILEWCQRSSNCPMCWQPISLKDAISQELLNGVEQERKLKSRNSINAGALQVQRPSLGDLGLQHLTLAMSEAEIEERLFRHLATAPSIRRGPNHFPRDGQRNRASSQARRPFVILTTSPGADVERGSESVALSPVRLPHSPIPLSYSPVRPNRVGSNVSIASRLGFLSESRSFGSQSSPRSQRTTGESMSESFGSRLSSWSMRYKESFSRSTRGWKMFARSNSSVDLRPEVHNVVNPGASGSSYSHSAGTP